MKKERNIFLALKYILIAVFCSAIYLHSYSEPCNSHIDLSSPSDSIENRMISDIDSSDVDQITESEFSWLTEQHESQMYEIFLMPQNNNNSDPVWQPPKVL
jgi:hypothetical protein